MGEKAELAPQSQELLEELTKGKPAKKKSLEKKKTYEFYNLEEPGLSIRFAYGTTTNPQKYTMWHGERYELTEEVARHVEERQTPIWGYRPNGEGRLEKNLIGWKPRFQMREVRS